MPKVMTTETLRNVTYELASDYSVAEIAKRHGVGRQWVYGWREKLLYHGLLAAKYLSDEILRAVYDKDIHTPGFARGYSAANAFENRKVRQDARIYDYSG